MKILKAFFETIKETFVAWQEDNASRLAAALAYYTIFSLAPLLIIAIAIIGLIFGESAAQNEIAAQISDTVGPDAASLIQTMIASAGDSQSGFFASVLSIGTMLFGASGLFNQLQDALNTIWHVAAPESAGFRHQIKKRFWHFVMVFGVAALLLLSLFSNIAAQVIAQYIEIGGVYKTLNALFSYALVTLAFAVIYKALPDANIAWRDVWVGAAVTSLLFAVGNWGIGLYMSSGNIGSTFGAAGSLIVLLVWIYYSTQIILLGAEFTQVYAHKFGSKIESLGAVKDVETAEDTPGASD